MSKKIRSKDDAHHLLLVKLTIQTFSNHPSFFVLSITAQNTVWIDLSPITTPLATACEGAPISNDDKEYGRSFTTPHVPSIEC
jgi:hypothetical protein